MFLVIFGDNDAIIMAIVFVFYPLVIVSPCYVAIFVYFVDVSRFIMTYL